MKIEVGQLWIVTDGIGGFGFLAGTNLIEITGIRHNGNLIVYNYTDDFNRHSTGYTKTLIVLEEAFEKGAIFPATPLTQSLI